MRALVLFNTWMWSLRGEAAPLPRSGVPDALEFSFGGFGADGRDVRLRGDTILVWRTPWNRPQVAGDTLRVMPTPDAWRTFGAPRTGPACAGGADRQGAEHETEMTDDFRAFMTALGELVWEPLLR